MQSKNETANLEKDPMSLSRRNAILATGVSRLLPLVQLVRLLKLTLRKVQLIKLLVT